MNPREYFENRIKKNESHLSRLKQVSFALSMSRLLVFVLTASVVYLFWGNNIVVASSLVIGIAGFLFLVSRYTDVKNKRDYHQKLNDLNELELKALDGDYNDFADGSEFLENDHPYNRDIDLFGEGSLFQRINRAGTIGGKRELAELLNSNDISNINEKQKAVQELRDMPDWRQNYQVTASMVKDEVSTSRMVDWMKNYEPVISKMFAYFPIIFAVLSLTTIVLYGIGIFPARFVLIQFVTGLAISGSFVKKVNKLYNDAGKMKETFTQYSKLILFIEEHDFQSENLKALKAKLDKEGKTASQTLSGLSRELGNLDQRNNIFFALLANGFILWDLRYAYRIEKWMKDNEANIEDWFEAVVAFDALNSLANYAFVHQDYIYPELKTNGVLEAKELGHPLLPEERRVDNDIKVEEGNFFIITGANMAGKSTFLRTVALNIVMSNIGLPVCAKSFAYRPIKLISSMRTSDSLKDDESYFFSELKRLKFIVNEIQKDTYFIILDEILKGTNSKDKAEGSAQFVEKLVASNSTGLIATHDLSLCTIADRSNPVKNYAFEAQIVNDELYFDYKFKEGVCQNMNASFLLKKMGIT